MNATALLRPIQRRHLNPTTIDYIVSWTNKLKSLHLKQANHEFIHGLLPYMHLATRSSFSIYYDTSVTSKYESETKLCEVKLMKNTNLTVT